jgi:hypothetical protein
VRVEILVFVVVREFVGIVRIVLKPVEFVLLGVGGGVLQVVTVDSGAWVVETFVVAVVA